MRYSLKSMKRKNPSNEIQKDPLMRVLLLSVICRHNGVIVDNVIGRIFVNQNVIVFIKKLICKFLMSILSEMNAIDIILDRKSVV